MKPKTLLVCLTTSEHADDLMKQAVALARRYDAHLIGLHTLEALLVYPGIAMHIPDDVFATFRKNQRDEGEKIKTIFERHTTGEIFPREFRILRAETVSAGERIVECARSADLVIMSQEDRDVDRDDQRNIQLQVIRESGRPVLVIPSDYDGPDIGSNVLLGWCDTREAARAAHDMLAVTQENAAVTILRVGPIKQDIMRDAGGVQMAETLSRHGLKLTLEARTPDGGTIAEVLGKVAFERGADMIVTGALGHSRAYDFVIGATTYALLDGAKLPVLYSK